MLLPREEMAPPPANNTAGRVEVEGQTEKANEGDIVGEAGDYGS